VKRTIRVSNAWTNVAMPSTSIAYVRVKSEVARELF
jgi:hypothetical protein